MGGNVVLHGQGYENPSGVETGTLDGGSGVTVTFTSQPNSGEVKVNIATSGGNESLVACVNQVNGKYMLFGFGVGPGTPYNIVLVTYPGFVKPRRESASFTPSSLFTK